MRVKFKQILIAGIPLYLALFSVIVLAGPDLGMPKFIEETAEGIWQSTLLVFWYVPFIGKLFDILGLANYDRELGYLPNSGAVLALGLILSLILYFPITIFNKRKKAVP